MALIENTPEPAPSNLEPKCDGPLETANDPLPRTFHFTTLTNFDLTLQKHKTEAFLRFTDVPENTAGNLIERRPPNCRITYEAELKILTVKLLRIEHENASYLISKVIDRPLEDMGLLGQEVVFGGGGGIYAGQAIRQPDSQWGKFTQASKFEPSITVETGFSQSLGAVQVSARHWVERHASVKIAIALKAYPSTAKIILQVWNATPPDTRTRSDTQRARKARENVITYDKASNTVNVEGNTITLSFLDIVGRPPQQAQGEGDIVITVTDLQRMATALWKFQGLI